MLKHILSVQLVHIVQLVRQHQLNVRLVSTVLKAVEINLPVLPVITVQLVRKPIRNVQKVITVRQNPQKQPLALLGHTVRKGLLAQQHVLKDTIVQPVQKHIPPVRQELTVQLDHRPKQPVQQEPIVQVLVDMTYRIVQLVRLDIIVQQQRQHRAQQDIIVHFVQHKRQPVQQVHIVQQVHTPLNHVQRVIIALQR